MSVYDHPNKPGWQMIKISHGRKEKPEYIPFPGTKEAAQIYEHELRGIADRSDPLFTDRLPEFKITYKNEVMPGTYTDFEWALKQLLPFFQNMKIRHITPLIIEQYKTMRTATVTKRTANRELSYLAKYLQFCNCDLKIVKFRKKDCQPPPPDVLTIEELSAIINILNPPVKYLVQLMSFNGLRKSEAFNLLSSQAEKDGTRVRILGKGGKWRTAPIELPELQQAIIEEKNNRPDGYLFPNPKTGKPYSDIRKQLKSAAKTAGIIKPVYNHLCRHSFATAMIGQGVNLRIIQMLLGHADLKMVQTYTHPTDNILRTGAASLVANVANPEPRINKASARDN